MSKSCQIQKKCLSNWTLLRYVSYKNRRRAGVRHVWDTGHTVDEVCPSFIDKEEKRGGEKIGIFSYCSVILTLIINHNVSLLISSHGAVVNTIRM